MIITINDKNVEIDDEDFDWINSIKWTTYKRGKRGNCFYFYYTKKYETIYLHRLLAKCKRGLVVDHIDHNTLNNKKSNLRIGTESQNGHNNKLLSVDNCIRQASINSGFKKTVKISHNKKFYRVRCMSHTEALLAYELLEWYFYREFSFSNNIKKEFKTVLEKIKPENICLFIEKLISIK